MTTGFSNMEITGDPDKTNVGRVGRGKSQWSSSNVRPPLIHFCNPPLTPPRSSSQQAMRKIGWWMSHFPHVATNIYVFLFLGSNTFIEKTCMYLDEVKRLGEGRRGYQTKHYILFLKGQLGLPLFIQYTILFLQSNLV